MVKATDLTITAQAGDLAAAPRPAHSPLGASGAERWMNCPGSVDLLNNLSLPQSDEEDWTKEGTAMHEAAAYCLNNGCDTWEITGQVFEGVEVDAEMARHIQVYLDHVRADMEQAVAYFVEFGISSPVHPDFYGTLDFGAVLPTRIKVKDLKGGAGIAVEVIDNPQVKYYSFGLIDGLERKTGKLFPDDTVVELGIIQPRAFHHDGPIRLWETTVGEIKAWVHDVLVPAMNMTAMDNDLDAGKWCRFCPAKLVCPLLTGIFRAAATCNPDEVIHFSPQVLGENYRLIQAVKFYQTALERAAMSYLNRGVAVPHAKLVNKKANRVFRSSADVIKRFGDDAYAPRELRSPAELEKLSPEALEWVKEHAYTPVTGTTVALATDNRPEVKVKPTTEVFAAALSQLALGE